MTMPVKMKPSPVMTSERRYEHRMAHNRPKVSVNCTRYDYALCIMFAFVLLVSPVPTMACGRRTCPVSPQCNTTEITTTSSPVGTTNNTGLACRPGSFQCRSQCACVPLDWVCDGRSDCQDGSDEFPDSCMNVTTTTSTTSGDQSTTSTVDPHSTVSVRLVNGSSPREGVVEIDWHGRPTYICVHKRGWDNIEAGVVCRMLGYSGRALATTDIDFPRRVDMGDTVLGMRCNGYETNIAQCDLSWDSTCYAGNREIASVTCEVNVDVNLAGGSHSAGSVNVTVDGVSGTICNEGMLWNDAEAKVVCHMLGFNTSDVHAMHGTAFHGDIGEKVWAATLWCNGSEEHIVDCRSEYRWGVYRCPQQASVICNTDMVVALRGGSDVRGTLELRVAGASGYICTGGMPPATAQVICQMLGKSGGTVLSGTAVSHGLPRGEGVSWLAYLGCSGSELNIKDCNRSPLGRPYCTPEDAVAIECN